MSPDAGVVAFTSFVAPSATRAMSTTLTLISSASTSASASLLATPKPMRAFGPSASTTTGCCASTPRPRQTYRSLPVPHDRTTPRARARAARLRANEAAERREDLAALITTPAQWALLRRSFASVKTEFVDLDGMSWNAPAPAPVVPTSTQAHAHAQAGRPGRPRRPAPRPTSVCGFANVPVLSLDDGTVRPNQGRKRRRCVGAWMGPGGYVNGSLADEQYP